MRGAIGDRRRATARSRQTRLTSSNAGTLGDGASALPSDFAASAAADNDDGRVDPVGRRQERRAARQMIDGGGKHGRIATAVSDGALAAASAVRQP